MANQKSASRDLAQAIFLTTDKSQEQIAAQVGVTPKTLSAWKTAGAWDNLKAAHGAGRQQLVCDLLTEAQAIRTNAKAEGRRLTSGEVLTIKNLTKSIAELDKKLALTVYAEIICEATEWCFKTDPAIAQTAMKLLDRFLDYKAAQVGSGS